MKDDDGGLRTRQNGGLKGAERAAALALHAGSGALPGNGIGGGKPIQSSEIKSGGGS